MLASVHFERSSLIISTDGNAPVRLLKKDGTEFIAPSFFRCRDGKAESVFHLASCNRGGCLFGEWYADGVSCAQNLPVSADYSKGRSNFSVKAWSDNGTVTVSADYAPTNTGVRDKITTFGIRLPYIIGRIFRGSKNRFLFTGEFRHELSGNMKYVLDVADLKNTDLRYSFFSGKNRLLFYIRTAFIAGRCSTVVVDDYYPLIYRLNFHNDRVIQLWHACGAFKTVGYSRLGKSGAPYPDDITHRNYTHVIVSSEDVRCFYAEAFGIPAERVYPLGVPRTDIFFDKSLAELKRNEFFEKFPGFIGKTVIMFAPTFRGDGAHSAHYPENAVDFDAFAHLCREKKFAVVFKMHPFVKNFSLPDGYSDVFADASDIREINDILFAADILITDYSSVIYEYSLLENPLIFYSFDEEEYCAGRDFYEPFENYAGKNSVRTFDRLLEVLRSGEYKNYTARSLKEHGMGACDGHSSERVARLIFGENAVATDRNI